MILVLFLLILNILRLVLIHPFIAITLNLLLIIRIIVVIFLLL
nr:MAG TPA: hypothetical protein [Caudoviricetes sp.]